MSKIYVAGKWQDRERIREIYKQLQERKHTITCDWTGHSRPDGHYSGAELQQYAIADIIGVQEADIVIAIVIDDYNYRGLWVEVGAALGLGKPVFLIGEYGNSCIFANHPLIFKFDSVNETVLRCLDVPDMIY